MTEWNDKPAVFVVLAKLVELHTRARRVDAELRRQNAEKIVRLLDKVR